MNEIEKKNICPCPNLTCSNHGNCKNCTSRHLRIGSLNYCAFYSILPELEEVVNADPNSLSAKMVKKRIERQMNSYKKYAKLLSFRKITIETATGKIKNK